ncbi:MAG: carboxypeptidase-like regulatory domain-containing protein [Planctomycetota bacterium]
MNASASGEMQRSRRWIAIGVVAALLAGFILWIYSSSAQRADSSSDARDEAAAPAPVAVQPVPLAPAPDWSSRAAIEVGSAPEPALSTAITDAIVARDELRGRVVDPGDGPVAGAQVSLRRGELRDFTVLDLELNRATELLSELTTDASGEFRFQLDRGVPVDVHVEAGDFCPAQILDRHAGEFVLVKLSTGSRVFGRVTRARDGVPVAEAAVRVFRLGGASSLERKTRTAGNGSFELRFAFRDEVTLEVVPLVEQCSEWIRIQLDSESQAERNVEVADGFVVQGKVSVAGSGSPIPGATVGEGWTFRRTAVTDASGEYRLTGFGDPGESELFAKARGYGSAKRQDLSGAVDGVMHVDFQLEPARRAHGRIVDGRGAPLSGALAAAIASDDGPQGQRTDWVSSRTDAAGRFEIDDLTSDLSHALMLSKHGYGTRVYDFPADERATVDLDLGTFSLGPPALIQGVVEDESGLGLADIEVILKGSNRDRWRLQKEQSAPERGIGDWYTDSRGTRTDAAGRFSFGELAAGTYSLRARQRGRPDSKSLGVSLAESERKEQVKLLLPSGSRLRGRVVDPEGRPVAGVSLSVNATKLREPSTSTGAMTSARSDADGRFEFLGLGAGEYQLFAGAWRTEGADSDTPLLGTTLDSVSTDSQDLEIVLARGATIRGSLHDASGAAVFGYSITNQGQTGQNRLISTDANGEFCLTVPAGSSCELEVRGPVVADWNQVLLVEHAVAAGTRGLKLVLP